MHTGRLIPQASMTEIYIGITGKMKWAENVVADWAGNIEKWVDSPRRERETGGS